MDPIIEAHNVSLEFALPEQAHESLKSYLLAKVSGHYKSKKFLALDGVSFSIGRGEAVGLIGRNGAGKSTLLRLVSGIATPTSGTIAVRGTVAPLLALGNGLDPELTGRENIYLNGAILGYDRDFLKNHEADIVGFSELGTFIDSQVRTYSSGMSMRLAFSIATAAAPEILVLDEVLAVGDSAFQAKCRNRLFEIIDSGATIFFVSHNPDDVRTLCSRAILLENGKIKMDGVADAVLAEYERMQHGGLQERANNSKIANPNSSLPKFQIPIKTKMTERTDPPVSSDTRISFFSRTIVGIRLALLRVLFGKSARGFLRHFDSWDATIAALAFRMGEAERKSELVNTLNEKVDQNIIETNKLLARIDGCDRQMAKMDIRIGDCSKRTFDLDLRLGSCLNQAERTIRSNDDDRKWDHFWVAYSEWWTNGASDALVDAFYLRERIDHFWNREMPPYWLIYICCLIERRLTGHALNMTRKYVRRFGYGEMFRYLPAASLAAGHLPGCPPQVLSAAVLFEKMSDPKRFNTFSSFLKGKTIAIVGNNRREVGRGLGSEIDAHDVVIRFNDHSFYRPEDYGSKMTIWCRNGSPTMFPDDERDLRETRFIVFMDDYWHTFVQGELLPVLGKRFDADTPVSVSPPSGIGASLRKESGLRNPTSEAYMVWLLRHVLGSFSGVDFYGFAFLDGNLSKDDTHADELFAWHEIDGEMQFLRKITSPSC